MYRKSLSGRNVTEWRSLSAKDMSSLVQLVEEDARVVVVVLMTLCHSCMRDHDEVDNGELDGGVWREY